MPYPGLVQKDHEILGSEYCSGYTDVYGKWNTGFYCPQTEATSAVFCCGNSYIKYCCTTKLGLEEDDDDDIPLGVSAYHVRIPVFFAIFCGALAILILLITAVCFFCSCCFVYKKRRDATSTGLYRIQGSSSTASALASIYSNQNNSSVVTTPLDSDWTLNTHPYSTYPTPYPFTQQSINSSSLLSPYPASLLSPSSAESNFSTGSNNNNCLPNFYYNNLTPRSSCNSQIANVYQYGRPLSALSTLSASTYSSNSPLSYPRPYLRPNQGNLHQQQHYQQQQSSSSYGFPNFNNLSISQQAYFYRQQIPSGRNNTLIQAQAALRNPAFTLASSASNGLHQVGQNPNVQQQQQNGTYSNGRILQNNGYQQRNSSSSMSYGAGAGGGSSNNSGLIRSGNARTQGNNGSSSSLSRQQQEQQLNQVIFTAIQNLIGSYRRSGANNANSTTTAANAANQRTQHQNVPGSRPNSLNNTDVNILNAINLRLSALNENMRTGSHHVIERSIVSSSGNGNNVVNDDNDANQSTTSTDTTEGNIGEKEEEDTREGSTPVGESDVIGKNNNSSNETHQSTSSRLDGESKMFSDQQQEDPNRSNEEWTNSDSEGSGSGDGDTTSIKTGGVMMMICDESLEESNKRVPLLTTTKESDDGTEIEDVEKDQSGQTDTLSHLTLEDNSSSAGSVEDVGIRTDDDLMKSEIQPTTIIQDDPDKSSCLFGPQSQLKGDGSTTEFAEEVPGERNADAKDDGDDGCGGTMKIMIDGSELNNEVEKAEPTEVRCDV